MTVRFDALAITTFLATLSCNTLVARPIEAWPYNRLLDESTLVIVVEAIDTKPPGAGQAAPEFGVGAEWVSPVVSRFKVLGILKGDYSKHQFELVHYVLDREKIRKLRIQGIGNGPRLVQFIRGHEVGRIYVLFLKKDSAGSYMPVSGHFDIKSAVKELLPPESK